MVQRRIDDTGDILPGICGHESALTPVAAELADVGGSPGRISASDALAALAGKGIGRIHEKPLARRPELIMKMKMRWNGSRLNTGPAGRGRLGLEDI